MSGRCKDWTSLRKFMQVGVFMIRHKLINLLTSGHTESCFLFFPIGKTHLFAISTLGANESPGVQSLKAGRRSKTWLAECKKSWTQVTRNERPQ